ncbi:MAG: hypothetical protein JZU53_01540 [Paludibacter sp.]|nr:hypothetical protein [Paludibacter sp.]
MFKYLLLTATLKEMMIMVKSLPTATLVLNRNCEIVEINQSGLDLFKIKSKNDYRVKRIGVLNNLHSIKRIQNTLISGKMIRDKSYLINCIDGKSIMVNFSASMIEGSSKMFIYQFFELAEFKINIAGQSIESKMKINKCIDSKGIKELFYEPENERNQNSCMRDEVIQFARRNLGLSNTEIVMCVFIESGMSVTEISKEMNMSIAKIQGIICRIKKKFDVQSRRDLYELLKNEFLLCRH